MKNKVFLVVLAVALLGGGCGRTKTTRVGDAAVTTRADGSGTVEIKTDQGNMTITGGVNKLPDGWPYDVPVSDNATVVSSLVSTDGSTVTLEEKGSVNEIAEAYRASMKEAGWVETSYSAFGTIIGLTWTQAESLLSASLQQEPGSDKVQIIMSVGKQY